MANLTEEQTAPTTENQDNLSQQVQTDQTPESQAGTETGSGEAQKQTPTPEEVERKYADLEGEHKKLKSQLTKTSQELEQTKKLLEVVRPFWDEANAPARAPAQPEADAGLDVSRIEDQEGYITRAEHKKAIQSLINQVGQVIKSNAFVSEFRSQFPDLGDKGPREQLVTNYFTQRLQKGESRETALRGAIEDARDFINGLKGEGAASAKAEQEKIDQEKKEKAAAGAAAAAAGLGSSGLSTPKAEEKAPTQEEQLAQMRAAKAKTKRVSP